PPRRSGQVLLPGSAHLSAEVLNPVEGVVAHGLFSDSELLRVLDEPGNDAHSSTAAGASLLGGAAGRATRRPGVTDRGRAPFRRWPQASASIRRRGRGRRARDVLAPTGPIVLGLGLGLGLLAVTTSGAIVLDLLVVAHPGSASAALEPAVPSCNPAKGGSDPSRLPTQPFSV